MTRVCMRPGCDRPAAARLSYNTVTCQVWLDLMPTRLGPVQEICDFHAEHLTVPRGWMLCDRRIEEPALFVPTVAGGAATSTRPANPSKRSKRSSRSTRSIRVPNPVEEADDVGSLASPEVSSSERPPRHPHPTELTQALFPDGVSDGAEGVEGVEGAGSAVGAERSTDAPATATDPSAGDLPEAAPTDGQPTDEEPTADDPSVDELPELLRAKSPLLSRAFRATGPQKSVLTHSFTGDDADPDTPSRG